MKTFFSWTRGLALAICISIVICGVLILFEQDNINFTHILLSVYTSACICSVFNNH